MVNVEIVRTFIYVFIVFVESMKLPLYKEWMGEVNKIGDAHIKGVMGFVKYAKRNLKREEISCL